MNWHAGLVLAVVVLAGCAGFLPGERQPTEVTPVPVSELDGAAAGGMDGTVDVRSVVRAHTDAALGLNYTIRAGQRTVWPNGTELRAMEHYREVGQNASRYRGHVQFDVTVEALREFGTTAYWTNGTHVATQFNSPLQPAQTRIWASNDTGPASSPSRSRYLATLLRATNPTVVERGDTGGMTLAGSRAAPEGVDTPRNLDQAQNLTVRLYLREDGLVHRWEVAYNATFRGETVRVLRTGRIVDTGETTVSRPSWVDNATRVREQNRSESLYSVPNR